MSDAKRKLRPVLEGEFWMIGDNPDLGDLQGRGEFAGGAPQQCVDHHIFQSPDGAWHLWGCIRHTAVNRLLYHWEGESLAREHWRQTGETIRVDRDAGEDLRLNRKEECIQSPFVVLEGGLFYMFYGGSQAGTDEDGNPVTDRDEMAGQMCLMTSPDGRNWTRHRNEEGRSRVFIGPGGTRDPVLIRIGRLWHLYYAGFHNQDHMDVGFYMRTSQDLIHWSDWKLVHQDPQYGTNPWDTECPHVVERAGYYYLFRTQDYRAAKTHVFRSEDPSDFGAGDAGDKYVGPIAVAAPEIILDEAGQEYITSNHNLEGGTMLCRLRWVEE